MLCNCANVFLGKSMMPIQQKLNLHTQPKLATIWNVAYIMKGGNSMQKGRGHVTQGNNIFKEMVVIWNRRIFSVHVLMYLWGKNKQPFPIFETFILTKAKTKNFCVNWHTFQYFNKRGRTCQPRNIITKPKNSIFNVNFGLGELWSNPRSDLIHKRCLDYIAHCWHPLTNPVIRVPKGGEEASVSIKACIPL